MLRTAGGPAMLCQPPTHPLTRSSRCRTPPAAPRRPAQCLPWSVFLHCPLDDLTVLYCTVLQSRRRCTHTASTWGWPSRWWTTSWTLRSPPSCWASRRARTWPAATSRRPPSTRCRWGRARVRAWGWRRTPGQGQTQCRAFFCSAVQQCSAVQCGEHGGMHPLPLCCAAPWCVSSRAPPCPPASQPARLPCRSRPPGLALQPPALPPGRSLTCLSYCCAALPGCPALFSFFSAFPSQPLAPHPALPRPSFLQDEMVGSGLLQLIQGRFKEEGSLQRALELVSLGGGIDK